MNLRRCLEHDYTLKPVCPTCKKPTVEAHYKFIKIKSIKESKESSAQSPS
jgi:hypothetical protein